MDRKTEILNYLCSDDGALIENLVDDFVFLEIQMTELKKLPFIRVHPNDPSKQKATPAAKQYKELLQQYTNVLKVLQRYDKNADTAEDSPLRAWVKKHVNS